jgi:P pilus assembly chaperone PapD
MKRTAAVLLSLMSFSLAANAMVSVNPELQVIGYCPGRASRCSIIVTNMGKAPADIEVQPEDWTKAGNKNARAGWLVARPEKFTLGPGKSRKVKLRALISDTTASYRITQVFFASIEKDAAPLNIGTRVGSLIKWEITQKK